MVHKNKEKRNKQNKIEKYILAILIISYVVGLCYGCYFVVSNENNAVFVSYITSNNFINTLIFFIAVILLKYSGILSGILYILPFFSGIQNSAYYCNILLNKETILHNIVFVVLRDTAVLFLLILYIIVTISQIINKKNNIKKDIKLFYVYISGALVTHLLHYVIKLIF